MTAQAVKGMEVKEQRSGRGQNWIYAYLNGSVSMSHVIKKPGFYV